MSDGRVSEGAVLSPDTHPQHAWSAKREVEDVLRAGDGLDLAGSPSLVSE